MKSDTFHYLLDIKCAYRLVLESFLNPHPVYKEILGMDDEEYNILIEEKRKAHK